tara:strand:+ start:1319 stop:1588 length:270 start_codon:yes stop_codon:yes gene_type:complete
MKLSPGQSLVLLILIGLALSGWLYGIHWKRIANGSGFSDDERLIIQLQDQIRTLTEANAALNGIIHDAENRAPTPPDLPEKSSLPSSSQ